MEGICRQWECVYRKLCLDGSSQSIIINRRVENRGLGLNNRDKIIIFLISRISELREKEGYRTDKNYFLQPTEELVHLEQRLSGFEECFRMDYNSQEVFWY
jgi:hypothetical protein